MGDLRGIKIWKYYNTSAGP